MSHIAKITWKDEMAFEASINGHTIILDADSNVGGSDRGPRPKILLLAGLGGCTGMDVISILAKMKVVPDEYYMEIEADLTDEHPKVYNRIKISYHFKGNELPLDKLEKAVNLSMEKYCGVTAMLSKTAKVETEIIIDK